MMSSSSSLAAGNARQYQLHHLIGWGHKPTRHQGNDGVKAQLIKCSANRSNGGQVGVQQERNGIAMGVQGEGRQLFAVGQRASNSTGAARRVGWC